MTRLETTRYCLDCGRELSATESVLCSDCADIREQQLDRPETFHMAHSVALEYKHA
jgi:NMD protein affecting ribosome stability and mRNA decay